MLTLETWQQVWREGIAPGLSGAALKALADALDRDDPTLTQGSTTTPPPLQCVQDWKCEAACALGFCGWRGDGLDTVGEVEEYFARLCFETDVRLGDVAGVRHFLNWFDDTPRDQMRRELLGEVRGVMFVRSASCGVA